MGNTPSERELLQIQIKAYEFYAGLIDRAVSGTSSVTMPKWDVQRAAEYKQLADELRRKLAELNEQETTAGDTANAAPSPQPVQAPSPTPTTVAE
jgi:hypothetical protein